MTASGPRLATERTRLGRLFKLIPPLPLAVLIALGLWAIGYQLPDTLWPSLLHVAPFDGYWDDVVFAIAALMMIFRPGAGLGWGLLGLGCLFWAAGDFYWTSYYSQLSSPPVPSWADGGYIAFYPLAFAGILTLVRRNMKTPSRTLIADAGAAALATMALCAAVVLQPVLEHAHGGTLAIATNLAYPVGDLALLGLIVGATALDEWRISRTWLLLAVAILAFWIADSFYLTAVASNTYSQTEAYNGLWYLSPVVACWACWLGFESSGNDPVASGTRMRGIVMLLTVSGGAVGILVWSGFDRIGVPAISLAAAAVGVVMVRLVMTWRENMALLALTRREASTDMLTGLANRRSLVVDLKREIESANDASPSALVLFDLDGFKHYNDEFGHLAGDALLRRLGRELDRCLAQDGRAYRMGGDEFCALIRRPVQELPGAIERAAGALSETGEGFTIGCSYGTVLLPAEASQPETALRVADQRMYFQKRGGRASASRQSGDVLLRALAERDPELRTHLHDVSELASATARGFGLSAEEVEPIRQGAELHDVGKMAIPDAILNKPGPLDESEWAFIRRHTVIGERIIDAAPALHRVASLVRSSHENFDGTGYPDCLSGEEIPLGARIISVCDAFDAMTTDRSYRRAMSEEDAIAELRRCAGAQFDPDVVERFCAALAARQRPAFSETR